MQWGTLIQLEIDSTVEPSHRTRFLRRIFLPQNKIGLDADKKLVYVLQDNDKISGYIWFEV